MAVTALIAVTRADADQHLVDCPIDDRVIVLTPRSSDVIRGFDVHRIVVTPTAVLERTLVDPRILDDLGPALFLATH